MQPTFLPWLGYFELILSSDVFVILDDAQYSKGSWGNRNKICINNEEHLITVPIIKKKLGQTFLESKINDNVNWRRKLKSKIELNYSKHDNFKCIESLLDVIKDENNDTLGELNIKLIENITKKLGISNKILFSSKLGIHGKRTDRLVKILEYINADYYISPNGAKEYLEKDNFSGICNISLSYQNYKIKPYPQKNNKKFISHLSIIDAIANLGYEKVRDII
jgi:hypothetical protein